VSRPRPRPQAADAEAIETIKKSGLRPKAIPHFKGQFSDQLSELPNWQEAA